MKWRRGAVTGGGREQDGKRVLEAIAGRRGMARVDIEVRLEEG